MPQQGRPVDSNHAPKPTYSHTIGETREVRAGTFAWINFVIIMGSVGVFGLISATTVSSHRFGYDEADYMFAARKGFYANYFDQDAISLLTFFEKGAAAVMGVTNRNALSEFIRQSDDTPFYRHYHGPLYFYWLILSEWVLGNNEYRMRLASLSLHLASSAVMYLGCLLVFNNKYLPAVISAFLLLVSPSNTATAAQITPHGLYVLTVLLSLFAMARLFQTKNLAYFSLSTVSICLAVITIEYSLLLVLTFVCSVFLWRDALFAGWSKSQFFKFVLGQMAIFVVILVVLWPGGLLKLTLFKNYLFFAYFTLFRGEYYGGRGFLELWWWRINQSPLEYILLLSLLLVFVVTLRTNKARQETVPFFVYALLILVTMLRNRSTAATYISSFLPPLYVLAGLAASHVFASSKIIFRNIIGTFVLMIALANGYFFYFVPNTRPANRATVSDDVVSYIQVNGLQNSRMLVPWRLRPVIHYYYPNTSLGSYLPESSPESILLLLDRDNYDGLFFQGTNSALHDKLEVAFKAKFQLVTPRETDRRKIIYYDLTQD